MLVGYWLVVGVGEGASLDSVGASVRAYASGEGVAEGAREEFLVLQIANINSSAK